MRSPAILLLLAACSAPLADEDLVDRPHQDNAGIDWRDQVVYQIVVDRFQNGDSSNDFNIASCAGIRTAELLRKLNALRARDRRDSDRNPRRLS